MDSRDLVESMILPLGKIAMTAEIKMMFVIEID